MDQALKERAIQAFHDLNLEWKLVNETIGGKSEWKEWCKTHELSSDKRCYSTIRQYLNFLEIVFNNKDNEAFVPTKNSGKQEKPLSNSDLIKRISRAEKTSAFLRREVNVNNTPLPQTEKLADHERDDSEFNTWFFYFLYVTPPGNSDKRPKIARAVLQVYWNTKKAFLINLIEDKNAKSAFKHRKSNIPTGAR